MTEDVSLTRTEPAKTPRTDAERESGGDDGHRYLLVFEGDSSRMVQLPRDGEVVLGRGDDVHVKLADQGSSRRHARLVLRSGEAHFSDLQSYNGTLLNGARLAGERPLASGDTITICATTLIYYSSRRQTIARRVLTLAELRQRAEEELERALRYRRTFSMLLISFGSAEPDRAATNDLLSRSMRVVDTVAWDSASTVVMLLPELASEGARLAAERIRATLAGHVSTVRAGFASCPADGCDVDTLLACARYAADSAPPGSIAAAASTYRMVTVGTRSLALADPAMIRVFGLIERLAPADLPVLICGETGVGKEIASQALHAWSPRRSGRFVTVNCAAIPDALVESELFGYERGAFSGAAGAKPGLLETAAGGTVFLDEVGELNLVAQAKLLRVLETKRITRLGDVKEREIDLRIVAATNRNLAHEVAAKRFRQDLYFRLGAATLWLPPLRDRRRELPILAHALLDEACQRTNRPRLEISDGAMQLLAQHSWPGNVRELKNVMEYCAAVSNAVVEAWDIIDRLSRADEASPAIAPAVAIANAAPISVAPAPSAEPTTAPAVAFRPIEEEVRELERARMIAALEAAGGNQRRAAELIAMPLRTFQAKAKLYDVRAWRSGSKDR